MKKYQSSYVLKQIKKKRIFEKKIHMDFPYGFSIQLDTRENCHFYNLEILQYIALACFRNGADIEGSVYIYHQQIKPEIRVFCLKMFTIQVPYY